MTEKDNKKKPKESKEYSQGLKFSNVGGLIGILLIGAIGRVQFGLGAWIWIPIGIIVFFVILKLFIPEALYHAIKSICLWLIFVGTILFVAFFSASVYKTGVWKGGVVAVGEVGVDKAVTKTGVAWYEYVKNPQLLFYDYYSWDQPKDVEDKPTRGVLFYGVETRRNEFKEGSPITIHGSARITALPNEDISVEFGCNLDDKDLNKTTKNKNYNKEGKLTLRGIEGNEINVYAGRDETIDFVCELNGLQLNLAEGTETDADKRKDKRKDIKTFVAKIEANYKNFETTTLLKVYNIQKEKLDQMADPFEGLSDPLLDSNKKMRSQCLSGCAFTKLAVKTSKQPQTEIGSYTITMGLRKEKDWYGDVLKLNEIQVSLPKNFELMSCEDFGGDDILDSSDQPYFDELNKEIKKKFGTTADYTFYCDYKILRPRIFMGFDEISVRTKYDYLVDTKKTVNVIEFNEATTTGSQDIGKSTAQESYEGYEEAEYYEV